MFSPPTSKAAAYPCTDDYIFSLRCAAIGAAILFSFFSKGHGKIWLPLPVVIIVSAAVNVLLSIYTIRQHPLTNGRPHLILAVDAAQASLGTFLAGGYYSAFFPLFIVLVAELAVTLNLRSAVAMILTTGALHIAAVILNQVGEWTALGASLAVSRFIALMIFGALAMVFSEHIRREEKSRREAEEHAAQLLALNELFYQLNQPSTGLDRAFTSLMDGAQRLLDAQAGAFISYDVTENWLIWSAGKATTTTLPGNRFDYWGWKAEGIYIAGPAYDRPLPSVWAGRGLKAVAGIRLDSLPGDPSGALIIGRNSGVLTETEWLLFRALAREAELAVRNMQLYANEHDQLLRLQQFEQTRQSFLSAIAHELRTPLTVLKTLLPALMDLYQIPPLQRSEIQAVTTQNLNRLETLITDFMESIRLEAGAVILHNQPLDLAQRVQHVVNSLRPLFLSMQQKVTLDIPPNLPLVYGDRRRVDQILSSLLHNAHKFAPENGAIRVIARANGKMMQVDIEDNGPGVPVQARNHIFKKFYSAPAESTRGGLGLGLYICSELVALHHGSLWYQERAQGGSCFCFTLPLEGEKDGKSEQENFGY